MGERVVYAMRYQDVSSGNIGSELQRSAWRYAYYPNIAPEDATPQPGLVITQRYIGPYSDLTITDINNEAWWTAQSVHPEDEVKRVLPLAGYKWDGVLYLLKRHGSIMLDTSFKTDTTQGDVATYRYPQWTSANLRWSKFEMPIRPFKKQSYRERIVVP